MFLEVYWKQPVFPTVCVSLYPHVYKILEIVCFCQSASGGIKSHSVTALVFSTLTFVLNHPTVCDKELFFGRSWWEVWSRLTIALVFSSTGWKPAELWHVVVSVVHLSVSLFLFYEIKSTFLVGFCWSHQYPELLTDKKKKKNRIISKGKVAILSWQFAFLVYAINSAFVVRFSWNLHNVSISSTVWTVLILKIKKNGQSVREK